MRHSFAIAAPLLAPPTREGIGRAMAAAPRNTAPKTEADSTASAVASAQEPTPAPTLDGRTQTQSAFGRISFKLPTRKQAEGREAEDGTKTKRIALGDIVINALDLPLLTAPFNVYRRLEKGAKTYSVTVNLAGKPAGPNRTMPYFGTTDGSGVPVASARLLAHIRREFDSWWATEGKEAYAKLMNQPTVPDAATADAGEAVGGDAADF